MSFGRITGCMTFLTMLVIASADPALAFCPMCRASIANAENATEFSQTVNSAVLILLIPTLLIIGGLVKLVFHYRHIPAEDIPDETQVSSSHSIDLYVNFRSSDSQRNLE